MSELENLSKEKLEKILEGLTSYRQGCIDTFEIIEENHKKCVEFYTQKISACKSELDKLNEKT